MIGYYLLTREVPKNVWLRWLLVILWDAGGVAFGIWIFFIRTISTRVYDSIAMIGGIGFVVMLLALEVYNRNSTQSKCKIRWRGRMRKIVLEKRENGFYEIFGQRFLQYNKYGSSRAPKFEFCKLKAGDRIEIKKVKV